MLLAFLLNILCVGLLINKIAISVKLKCWIKQDHSSITNICATNASKSLYLDYNDTLRTKSGLEVSALHASYNLDT